VSVQDEIHRMTVDEYLRVVRDLGWESTELIEGVVYDVTPEYNRHRATAKHVFRCVDAFVGDDRTNFSGSVHLGPYSMVDPDVYVLDGTTTLDPDDAVPEAAMVLAIEVSVTTQARDRGPKLRAYAKAGVPEVWLIDPRPDVGELVRHRDPDGASYRTVDRFDVGEDARDLDVASILAR
jgi:Uma2 family endonuclease